MSLIETLVKVGPTIGKHILKRWLKSHLSQDLSKDILDLLAEKIPDMFVQQRAKRQFEEIGERVAEELLPVFEHEGRSLDEDRRTAVVRAVNDTLKQTAITANLLMQKDLSPTELTRKWRQTDRTKIQHFSVKETRLYNRFLDELAIYIVDIASQLPHFTERTFSKLLKRGQVLHKADEVLVEIRHIRQAVGDSNKQAPQFEADYRLAVIRQLDELELFGVDLSEASRCHRLSVAYVTLQAEQKAPDGGQKRVTMSVNQALATSNRLLVRGRAGSGKTTLLKWVAVQTAAQKLQGPQANWNRLVPFFIRLRQVRDRLPDLTEFTSFVAPEMAETMPPQWVHQLLEKGQAIVLVDGLDELPEAQRKAVETWLSNLIRTYSKTNFIVTSRPHVEVGWLMRLGFKNTELQDMNFADIDLFIDRWHEAVAVTLEEIGRFDKALPELATHLKNEIRDRRALKTLAVNPLLCAMLCALNRKRRRKLPSVRLELYEACVHMLLERRDIERSVGLSDYPNLSYTDKKTLLCDLAYWMLLKDRSVVLLKDAEQRLARTMLTMPNLPRDARASNIRRFFIERSCLLREPVKWQLDFTHRTFQEYLAAEEAINKGHIQALIDHAHDEDWWEVIIVAVGKAGQEEADYLLKKLVQRGDKERNKHFHHLANACVDTIRTLKPATEKMIKKRVTLIKIQIAPPTNRQESRILANMGPSVVPILRYRAEYSPQVAQCCIETLSEIGSQTAWDALKSYLGDKREIVKRALLNAWDSFDRQSFAQEILKPLVGEQTAFVSDAHFSSLEGFEQVPHLERLTLGRFVHSTASDLTPLKNLTHLNHLSLLNFSQITSLVPLRGLTALTSLVLKASQQVKELTPLYYLTALTSLDLSLCQQVSDLTPLRNLTTLTSLNLSFCKQVSDLTPLRNLTRLTSLQFNNCQQVRDLTPLRNLTALTSLQLNDCQQVRDLTPLRNLTALTSLQLNRCQQVSDLTALGNLTALISLQLNGCLQMSDLTALGNLTALTSLQLNGCQQVSDLTPLADLTALTSLVIRGCKQVSDLTPLRNLKALTFLDLNDCQNIRSLMPLKSLTKLKKVKLEGIQTKVLEEFKQQFKPSR